MTEKRKLLVVYKKRDEIALNFLKKLVETKDDDVDNDKIVGTVDNSVSIIAWTDKEYKDNRKSVTNKTVFLDDVNGAKNLIPIMDIKFRDCGVMYGVAGNQAVVAIDESAIKTNEDFDALQERYNEVLAEVGQEADNNEDLKNRKRARAKHVGAIALTVLNPLAGKLAYDAVKSEMDSIGRLRKMMFMYGLTRFYLDELEGFLNS